MNVYLYEEKNTIIHKLDPRTKLLTLLISFILFLKADNILEVSVIFSLLVVFGLVSGMFSNILKLKFILTGIFIFSLVSWAFFYPSQGQRFFGLTQ